MTNKPSKPLKIWTRKEINEMQNFIEIVRTKSIEGIMEYLNEQFVLLLDYNKSQDEISSLKKEIETLQKQVNYYKNGWEAQTRQCEANTKLRMDLEKIHDQQLKAEQEANYWYAEWGFKQHEKGHNLQYMQKEFRNLIQNTRDKR